MLLYYKIKNPEIIRDFLFYNTFKLLSKVVILRYRIVNMITKAFTDYLLLEKKYSKHTVLAYQNDLKAFLEFTKAEMEYTDATHVSYSMVRSWIVTLVDSGLNNKSINRKISSLKTFYKYLLKTKQIDESPLAKHKSLKVSKSVQIIFSEKEINQTIELLSHTDDFENLRNKTIVELFYATGIRKSELINLTLSNINIEQNTIKVLGKRNKERIIPLIPQIINTIEEYIKKRETVKNEKSDKYLFLTKKGVKISQTLVYRIINNYFSKVSTKVKKSPHILRHSFATHLLNNGADLNAIKEILGHSSLASTQVYTNNSISELKKVYAKSHPRNKK